MAGIIRVARDKSAVIVKVGDTYHRVSADLAQIDKADSLASFTSEGTWRKPVSLDVELFKEHTILAEGGIIVEGDPVPERQIRLPKSVQRSLQQHAEALADDPITLNYLQNLASATTTTVSQVTWLKSKVFDAYNTFNSVGGQDAYTWFMKIDKSGGLTAAGESFTPSDDLEYFGITDEEGATKVSGLIAVSREDDLVLTWTPGGFIPAPESISEYEAPGILEVDPDTAAAVATWINEGGSPTEGFDVASIVSGEQNLVDMALAETEEWANIDELANLLAAAADYTPAERSVNAQRQERQGGGKFGGDGIEEEEPVVEESVVVIAKAHLPIGLDLLVDPAARIAEYLGTSGPTAAPQEAAPVEETPVAPVTAALAPDDPSVSPLYIAMVDPVDNTAVVDIAAILPGENGEATAWVRSKGVWAPNNDIVASLQGPTPPPVVELTDEPTIQDVLSQVDAYDSSTEPVEETEEVPAAEVPVVASALFGNYGEILPAGVIIAAGVPGISDTPSDKASTERLMRYWSTGPGAAKIRWGTKGDLTRAHRYLSKYVGPKRAWGLAQNLHKRIFGVPNKTHDIATGQD